VSWYGLSDQERGNFYERFEARYNGVNRFNEPESSITIDLRPLLKIRRKGKRVNQSDVRRANSIEPKMRQKVLTVLQDICGPGERVYALDWYHEAFWFYPNAEVVPSLWLIPVTPRGEYYMYVSEDLEFGLLGDLKHQTLCIWHYDFAQAIFEAQPYMNLPIIRLGGRPLVIPEETS
jgi:hypothetical protein